ncbi:MAG TPA: DKNYY domain-containing protein [Leptospiraceae bacterium]|nr:DKNYY domain-containing protein [Leptospiraceae bacterium]HNB96814.1 DKNYY domain-containing protein [Leptospiraceae bacterium]HNE08267.1 DKNYY domain-containing protein [Leptospiraceae bacterium]HNG99214.1 DKNYY domain-containing protein [Leptospiraceae bacterium]HNI87048.1 DKNYY domain-containing protein [Leptospiraceae bacterium]
MKPYLGKENFLQTVFLLISFCILIISNNCMTLITMEKAWGIKAKERSSCGRCWFKMDEEPFPLRSVYNGTYSLFGYIKSSNGAILIYPNFLIDVPLSFALDTVLLPISIPNAIIREMNFRGYSVSTDKFSIRKVYFQDEELDLNPDDFIILKNGNDQYARDSKKVYYRKYQIEGADPDSFNVLEEKEKFYSKDKNRVFFEGTEIKGADVISFQAINAHYSKDKKSVFFKREIIDGANPIKFRFFQISSEAKLGASASCDKVPSELYSTDGQFVFYGATKIKDADIKTFVVTGKGCNTAEDKYHFFLGDSSYKKEIK